MLSPEDAEEALADVYIRAWRSAACYSFDRGSVNSWLLVMTRTIAIDRLRSKRSRCNLTVSEVCDDTNLVCPAASPEKVALNNEQSAEIAQLLGRLTPQQRELLEMLFWRGFTHSEVSKLLGQPLGTVKTRIRTAMARLRTLFHERNPAP